MQQERHKQCQKKEHTRAGGREGRKKIDEETRLLKDGAHAHTDALRKWNIFTAPERAFS